MSALYFKRYLKRLKKVMKLLKEVEGDERKWLKEALKNKKIDLPTYYVGLSEVERNEN